MRLWDNKKGKSIGSDSPFWVVIKIEYHRFFGVSKVLISWRTQQFLSYIGTGPLRGFLLFAICLMFFTSCVAACVFYRETIHWGRTKAT